MVDGPGESTAMMTYAKILYSLANFLADFSYKLNAQEATLNNYMQGSAESAKINIFSQANFSFQSVVGKGALDTSDLNRCWSAEMFAGGNNSADTSGIGRLQISH